MREPHQRGATQSDVLQGIVDFILAIDQLKGVTRKTRPLGLDRYENSAEHSWQIALLALSLEHFAAEPVHIDRVVRMLLVHDIGEIDTGDTMAYVIDGWAERKAAEAAAVVRIMGTLPAPRRDELIALWHEFEAGETPEACLANAVDRAMPVLLNLANNGQSWRENGITYERVLARVRDQIQRGCPALWDHLAERLVVAQDAGWFSTTNI
jgi:putative hydrolases of HD superfamily